MDNLNIDEFKSTGRAMGIITPDTYHALKGQLPNCISKSGLSEFADNPYRWKYNKDHGIKKTSTGFRWGSLVDTIALTPWEYDKKYMVGFKRVALTKDGKPHARGLQDPAQKAEWEAMEANGVTILTQEEAGKAWACAAEVTSAFKDKGLVIGENADTQVGFMFRLNLTVPDKDGKEVLCPITCTGMIDLLPQDPSLPIIDLKTTSTLVDNAHKINRSIADYKYGWQAAMYCDMLQAITGETRDFSFLFVENEPPFCMTWRTLGQTALDFYRMEYRKQLYRYAQSIVTGEYPGRIIETPEYIPAAWEAFQE